MALTRHHPAVVGRPLAVAQHIKHPLGGQHVAGLVAVPPSGTGAKGRRVVLKRRGEGFGKPSYDLESIYRKFPYLTNLESAV